MVRITWFLQQCFKIHLLVNIKELIILLIGPSVDSLRETTSASLSSQDGENFLNIRKITSTYLMFHVKSWND